MICKCVVTILFCVFIKQVHELIFMLLRNRLSSLLSSTRSKGGKRQNRYKGFLMNDDDIRRANRDSDKDDDKPRQNHGQLYGAHGKEHGGRGNHGGSGSGGNSHTAIPYLKSHGDIYERDE